MSSCSVERTFCRSAGFDPAAFVVNADCSEFEVNN